MKRREAREIAFKLTYEMVITGEFNPQTRVDLLGDADAAAVSYVNAVTEGIQNSRDELKALIARYAVGYEFDRIYKLDLAILYLACYELKHTDTPPAVIVNEAVELAKQYSDVKSHAFINGILASVIKGE